MERIDIMKNKDYSVQLLRIIACFMVICIHTYVGLYVNNEPNLFRIILDSLICDSVAYFWFIMGFFCFNKFSYKKTVIRTIRKIIIPAFLILIVIQILSSWISGDSTFVECVMNHDVNFKNIFNGILIWSADNFKYCQQYWYIFFYVQVIIWLPLLEKLCTDKKNDKLIRYFFIVLVIIYLLVLAIQQFVQFNLSIYSVYSITIMEVMLGYEIYIHRDKIKGNKLVLIIGLSIYILGNIVRSLFQFKLLGINHDNSYFMCWNTLPSIICAPALTVAILAISINNTKLQKIISFISQYTFFIYLIHWAILAKCASLGLNLKFYKGDTIGNTLYYFIVYNLLIFFISLVCAIAIKQVSAVFCTFVSKIICKYKLPNK